MLTKTKTCALVGLDGEIVDVEVDISPGLPTFTVVARASTTPMFSTVWITVTSWFTVTVTGEAITVFTLSTGVLGATVIDTEPNSTPVIRAPVFASKPSALAVNSTVPVVGPALNTNVNVWLAPPANTWSNTGVRLPKVNKVAGPKAAPAMPVTEFTFPQLFRPAVRPLVRKMRTAYREVAIGAAELRPLTITGLSHGEHDKRAERRR